MDRRALEGAVAKTGKRSSTSSTEFKESRERRESGAHSRVVLNCPGLDLAHRRLVQSERRYGAEAPPARLVFARHFHVTKNNLFLPLY